MPGIGCIVVNKNKYKRVPAPLAVIAYVETDTK